MMIDPKTYIECECKGKSYKELLKIRDELLESVYDFENNYTPSEHWIMSPAPEEIYQKKLKYLGELCKYISETYNKEVVWGDKE